MTNDITKLTLDTHVMIWYLEGINLSPEQVALIDEARGKQGLFFSNISIWEIAMLALKGKICFSVPLNEWVNKLVSNVKVNLIDISPEILIESCSLLNYNHQDPSDRIIIASCRKIDSHLMTFDQRIITYAKQGYLKVL